MTRDIAADALDLKEYIRPGDRIVVGQGGAEALTLSEILVRQRAPLGRVSLFLGPAFAGSFRPEHADHLAFTAYAASGSNQALARAGLLDIMPVHYSELSALFSAGETRAEIVLLQLAPEGRRLGMANDYQIDAARRARVVIVEINERVPETPGSELPDDIRIDVVIRSAREPAMMMPASLGAAEAQIAERVASLVPDGATLELGIGALPDAILAALTGHRDLGLHSGMLGDGVVTLAEAGALTNARKPIDTGISIGGLLFGTRRLFDFAHRNPALRLMPPTYTHGHQMLRQLPSFIAINSAVEADLTGQVNGESLGGAYVGAIGGQVDFMRGAIAAGGRSIIALPATAKGGTVSRITAKLGDAIVTSLRSDMDTIVTEYGIAELRHRSLAERARRMIAIAAPQFREELERAAHALLKAGEEGKKESP
ncbi:MAG TPA: acetyl-CoA hydrolase/transferase C-terminal domain-containing protein [Stellaceae bacterium]|nr:acetyl-CoA hydrolase/transferase C-terminal domain-containing protein [Stellaceae bacterium]